MTNPKKTPQEKAALLEKMGHEADRVKRKTGAEACIVICMFKDGDQLTVQDAGLFPMPPTHFYNVMIQAHKSGMFGGGSPIIKLSKPH